MKAAAILIDLETKECNWDVFDGKNPVKDAWNFINGVKNDFPDRTYTVVGDQEAHVTFGEYFTDKILDKN